MPASGRGPLVIRSVSATQRPRRRADGRRAEADPITNRSGGDENVMKRIRQIVRLPSPAAGNALCDAHPVRTSRAVEVSQMNQRAGVGSSVVIKGELSAHEDVVIAGRVEGSIN